MPPTGELGFEGLVARLLSALTGDRFFIARSGDQPADAISESGGVAIQAKRYAKTPLDETEFEGDFHKACREFPELDCYVLAATRTTGQLFHLASELEEATGVDVVLLSLGEFPSELPCLCVTFWSRIQHFPVLCELDSAFGDWAGSQAERDQVQSELERLRRVLTESVPVFTTVKRKIHRYLLGRFGVDSSLTRPARFPIHLPKAVPRVAPHRDLLDWWADRKNKAAVVIGEEGMGKSWLTAQFCLEIWDPQNALVLWLDSADWSGIASLQAVVDAGLLHAGFDNVKLRERLVRKSISRWRDRLLVVLDGVNERSAKDSAHKLLAQLYASDGFSCRLLFTTRPILWKSDENSLWNQAVSVKAVSFTEEELTQALARLPGPVPRSELSPALAEVARIPRYFTRVIELRSRFQNFANVSKEMVLWSDLLHKVESGDTQVAGTIGWMSSADIERALLKLANAARAVQGPGVEGGDGYALLQKCFGDNFVRIRTDLAEQRIVLDPLGSNPKLSPEHLTLGFALHLRRVALECSTQPILELVARFQKELEPLLAQDQLTEALFVALQLSSLQERGSPGLSSSARSAFLIAWAGSQNARVEPRRLLFWANEDPTAYLDFVESVFLEPVSLGWIECIVNPLKESWRKSPTDSALDARMRRWLKLFWRSHDLPCTPDFEYKGHQLPIAKSRSQLVLSRVTLAVLSESPILSFLPDLAIAWSTTKLSTDRHIWKNPTDDGVEKQFDMSCKELHHNLGAILRWRYSEAVVPHLRSLLVSFNQSPVMEDGLESMMQTFDEFGWRRMSVPEKSLRDGTSFFPGAAIDNQNRFMGGAHLAIRDDLPELCDGDREVIAQKIRKVFENKQAHSGYSRTLADIELDHHLAWFVRYFPQEFIELSSDFRSVALVLKEAAPALNFANGLPCSYGAVENSEWLDGAKACANRKIIESAPRCTWTFAQLHLLAFTSFSGANLKDWLLFASERSDLRHDLHLYSIRIVCPELLPDTLAHFSRRQAMNCADEAPSELELSDAKFDFWAWLGGLAGVPDHEFHKWVDDQFRNRCPTGNRRYYWTLLWFRSAPQHALEASVANGSILKMLAEDGFSAMVEANRRIENWSNLPSNLANLFETLAIDDVGTVLLAANRKSDLDIWGRQIFERALELLGQPVPERAFWGETIYTINDSGRITGATCSSGPPASELEQTTLRPIEEDGLSRFRNQESEADFEKRENEGIRGWRKDRETLRSIGRGAFDRFDASEAVLAWRDRNMDLFRSLALDLARRVETDPEGAFSIAGFISCVVVALVTLEPEEAMRIHALLNAGWFRVKVLNHYGVSAVVGEVWQAAGRGNPSCRNICLRLIEGSSSDKELMEHSITAQAEGALEFLTSVCDQLLASAVARERCLAVSLLAWVPEQRGIGKLDCLSNEDPSGWVRRHSEWAAEVARQEAAMRRHYLRALRQSEKNLVLCDLQILRFALSPSALWWHGELEQATREFRHADPSIKAVFELFWNDCEGLCKKTPDLFGRKLDQYLRGEKVSELRTPVPRLLDARATN